MPIICLQDMRTCLIVLFSAVCSGTFGVTLNRVEKFDEQLGQPPEAKRGHVGRNPAPNEACGVHESEEQS
ncbi:hypothetical protein CgunFtcFv8_021340 [Champsocephalus gunnari]|uniref:Uncharacterized protein n=1 Tax=Champsocephalus gunnari TaxID=52237 RepID=A0AAN8I276_CHAGU|nr:hypothetical protein CgunFtcFv8_021340 [Champsocephalus gunnari]